MNDLLEKLRESGAPERRSMSASEFEIRKNGDSLSLEGYASVFNAPYDMYGGPAKGGFTEKVDRAAFDVTLREKPDLHLLINHAGLPLARTKSGTLQLSTDDHGLLVLAPNLDRRDPDVQRLEVKMERGDMDEMSFGFRTVREEFNEDTAERRLLEVSIHKGDVSVVNFGANPSTSAKIRSLFDQLADVTDEELVAEIRAAGDTADVRAMLRRALAALPRPDDGTLTVTEARKRIFDL